MEWEAPPRGYYLTDVRQETLWVDAETGVTWALVRFPPGVADRLNIHPKANQFTVALSGEVEMPDGGIVQLQGQAATIMVKGEVHGRTKFTKETVILFYWDGPPDPQAAE